VIALVTGTGTAVGKTWFTARAIESLAAEGVRAAARKPAQSFAPGDGAPTDADVLGAASGEDPGSVCPAHRWYPVGMAPPMAAEVLAREAFTIAELVAELAPSDRACTFVESAGGVRSPLASDGDTVDLCRALAPDIVVLVADAGLGMINAVRLSVAALPGHDLVVALNRYDDTNELHRANATWLRDVDALTVVTSPAALAHHIGASIATA